MKKALAVLLAVVMAFSVCVVCVSAEDDGETPAGTVYALTSAGLGRINVKNTLDVVIFQAGDRIEFGTVTVKTSETKFRTIKVNYYPDAASIKSTNVKNPQWQDEMVPKYNLDSEKWTLDTTNGQTAADLMAKSPNYFKSFYTTANFFKGDTACADIVGIGDLAHARDSAGIDRGDLENGNPIDYALPGAKFLGWALYNYDTWKANGTGVLNVELYALWERGAAEEQPTEPEEPEEPVEPDAPVEYATPIQATLAKWLAKIAEIFDYIGLATALPAGLNLLLNGVVIEWLYGLFGIEA